MEEKAHGGRRLGAGRKPVVNKKKQVTLYVETKLIFPFGTEEKMKNKLYEFIKGYEKTESNVQYSKITPESYDGKRITPIDDEPLSFDKLRQQITPKPFVQYKSVQQYMKWKREIDNEDEYQQLLADIESNPILTKKEKEFCKTANPSQL